jgi:hypothetical protein
MRRVNREAWMEDAKSAYEILVRTTRENHTQKTAKGKIDRVFK